MQKFNMWKSFKAPVYAGLKVLEKVSGLSI